MALRIEYLRRGERVMLIPCPKSLDGAKLDALVGLAHFDADTARILDMDHGGKVVAVVKL